MSELIDARGHQKTIRRQLLTTVSMLVLLPCISSNAKAESENSDRPTVWIELGGQLERQTGQGDSYDPYFVANNPTSPAYKPISPLQAEKPPIFGIGGEAKLSFEPEGSDWVFSAAVRYGRANASKAVFQKTPGKEVRSAYVYGTRPSPTLYPYRSRFHCCHTIYRMLAGVGYANTRVTHRDAHTILDFQAGKDVGLGLFGHNSESRISAGVRFAQFEAKSGSEIYAIPSVRIHNLHGSGYLARYPGAYAPTQAHHVYAGYAQSTRSFHGLGPAISWSSSIALLGNTQGGMFFFDWGANAAVLFGRRKASGQHHQSSHYVSGGSGPSDYYTGPVVPFGRSHTVTVPNVGGFAGVSFKFPNAKISMGYRGDFFFGAMDGGIDTARKENVGFYGPFASISVGLGG